MMVKILAEFLFGNFKGMYCLGGVTDSSTMTSSSPSNVSNGNRDCVLSVVRALGVLICEGRIQGSPRGYKEGPHCAAPLQSPSTQHLCKKDDYLCNRYVILVKEIADRTAIGTSLCVEVFMCADCPCGLSMATCNDPVSSIAQWSNTSEMLLEYWCIRVVPSKSSEVMNFQGLYQAVRSRLHFSQVAAWWSRSSGKKPKYVSTRVVSSSSDNLRKFIDPPIEHTFPLASIGDGNSVKVTVWALPRIEDVPKLHCQIHPVSEIINDNTACALLTPTKASSSPSSTITSSSSSSSSSSSTSPTTTATPPSSSSLPLQYPENHTMVLPIIVDDRLQTPCDQPGKHHCRCEEEETSPPSPSIKPNGERKRRRSLPCGPPDATPSTSLHGNTSLASVSELNTNNIIKNYNDDCKYYDDKLNDKKWHDGNNSQQNYINTITNDRYLINNDDNECNDEKRYKPSSEVGLYFESLKLTNDTINKIDKKQSHKIYDNKKNDDNNKTNDTINLRKTNIIVNPFYVTNPGPSNYNYNNINNLTTTPCNVHLNYNKNSMPEEELNTNDKKLVLPSGELSHLMSKLSFPKDTSKNIKDDGGLFDWITKVPSRVLNGNQNTTTAAAAAATITTIIDDNNDKKIAQDDDKLNSKKVNNYIKLNNCNLELSQREFNEVLAVLKTRTPIGKRRTPVKNLRKKEKFDKTIDEQINTKNSTTTKIASTNEMNKPVKISDKKIGFDRKLNKDKLLTDEIINTNEIVVQNKADVLLGAILRTNCDRKGLGDISNGSRTETIVSLNSQQETEEYEKQNDKKINQQQLLSSPFKIKPYEDDKFLPSVINKRLHRIKQLFKKEQEPKVYNERHKILHDSHDNNNIKYKHHNNNNESYNKIKRKIDFADFNICGNKNSYEQLLNDPDNLHNNVQKCEKKNVKSYYFDDNNADLLSDNLNNDLKNQDGCEGRNESDDKFDNEIINDEIVIMGKNQMSQEDVDDEINDRNVPSAIEQEQFRRSLENAASMVFHSRTGLPLTSSPAPLRRGHCCFDYDSSLNTVSSKRSALFELNTPPSPGAVSLEETDREVENVGDGDEPQKRSLSSRARPQSHALLGNFEESALNGRLEPVSTVHGFTAEIGASGSFCPKHRKLPVTVFFYTLGDNDKVSTPYLAHINLEKKGYQVPRSGTIQVTLLNPLGTVVKMFVVLYDLSDMPPRSHTFLRQRTLRDKTLRYLIHLRFMSGKSGRIYLHTDIRIIICRKSDVDTASDFGSEPPKELRSYIHGPTNPKFSPRC